MLISAPKNTNCVGRYANTYLFWLIIHETICLIILALVFDSIKGIIGWLVADFDQRINRLQVTAYVDPRVTASMTARGFRHAVMAR